MPITYKLDRYNTETLEKHTPVMIHMFKKEELSTYEIAKTLNIIEPTVRKILIDNKVFNTKTNKDRINKMRNERKADSNCNDANNKEKPRRTKKYKAPEESITQEPTLEEQTEETNAQTIIEPQQLSLTPEQLTIIEETIANILEPVNIILETLKEEIIASFKSDKTLRSIAINNKINIKHIKYKLLEWGEVEVAFQTTETITKETQEQIFKLYILGVVTNKIARLIGTNKNTLIHLLREIDAYNINKAIYKIE